MIDEDRPTALETEQKAAGDRWIPHGLPGHIGFRCSECAYESGDCHPVYTLAQSVDIRQNQLLAWNEENDMRLRGHINDCPLGMTLRECEQHCLLDRPTMMEERIR